MICHCTPYHKMKVSVRKLTLRLHEALGRLLEKWNDIPDNGQPQNAFHSLSPINNAEVDHYIDALSWALNNQKAEGIYNIALTGPYGSGKSSILKTFQAKNPYKASLFLEISLATFKEEEQEYSQVEGGASEPEDTADNSVLNQKKKQGRTKDDLLRLIELSILQQIFYHEEDGKIPDSRFKKIKSFKRKHMIWITVAVMTALSFGLDLFWPRKFQELLQFKPIEWADKILHWLSLVVVLASLSVVIFRSIRLAYGIQVSKLKFNDAEIEIDKNISKSILNNHLDEILYFFEVTDYAFVVIEDLDRFRQAEIFTKLRELNLLINNSKKIKQEVVFIYAVRDEMFRNKDRTKFFDFIIPVIPVINSSNSNEKMAAITKDNHYEISPDLIDDISFFIDDMRLLYNIMNEFRVYRQLLGVELNQDKLLAMVVYKNIYPDDFVALSNGKGKLYKLVNSRQTHINDRLAQLDKFIVKNRAEITDLENGFSIDEIELRMIYLTHYMAKISGFAGFYIQGIERSAKEIATDESLFSSVVSGDVNYYHFQGYSGSLVHRYNNPTGIKLADIENEVDSTQTYAQRLEKVRAAKGGKIEKLKQDIQVKEKTKSDVRHLKLMELLADRSAIIEISDDSQQSLLVKLLLRSGYIDEDYLDYISLFYEGSITKEDRTFLLNVKSQTSLDHDYKLTKVENLVGKIRPADFLQPYILNFSLLDHLLTRTGFEVQLNALLGQLHDLNDFGPGFVEGFVANGQHVEQFINLLSEKWPTFWEYVDQRSALTAEQKENYFKLILSNASLAAIQEQAKNSSLVKKIELTPSFLNTLKDQNKTKNIIKVLNVKFDALDIKDAPKFLVDLVYDHSHYHLNEGMIRLWLAHAGKYVQVEFDEMNYHVIRNSGKQHLIDYVHNNIQGYIDAIYLERGVMLREPEPDLLDLLNNENISLESRETILLSSETMISNIGGLTHTDLDDVAFSSFKLEPVWENLSIGYRRANDEISDAMSSFMSHPENARELSKKKIEHKLDPKPDLETLKSFIIKLVNSVAIPEAFYDLLMGSVPYWYEMDKISDIDKKRIEILIKRYVIKPGAANFAALKARYPAVEIQLVETNRSNFFEQFASYELKTSDVYAILRSAKFTVPEKKRLIELVDEALITGYSHSLELITDLIFGTKELIVTKTIITAALRSKMANEKRVKLFNMHFQQYTKDELPEIFTTFPYPYSDIGIKYRSPLISYAQEDVYLAKNLRTLNFIASIKEEKKGIRLFSFKK
jgi:hypothetical protein